MKKGTFIGLFLMALALLMPTQSCQGQWVVKGLRYYAKMKRLPVPRKIPKYTPSRNTSYGYTTKVNSGYNWNRTSSNYRVNNVRFNANPNLKLSPSTPMRRYTVRNSRNVKIDYQKARAVDKQKSVAAIKKRSADKQLETKRQNQVRTRREADQKRRNAEKAERRRQNIENWDNPRAKRTAATQKSGPKKHEPRPVSKYLSSRKKAKDVRPKDRPVKKGQGQITRQQKNKDGYGNKMKTDGNQTPHFHDYNHENRKAIVNMHYRVGKKKFKKGQRTK